MVRGVLFAAVCWLFLVGIVVQVFLAGAGLFELTDFTPHGYLGWVLPLVPIVMVVLAALARVDRPTMLLSIGVLVMAMIQPELAAARDTNPVLAAFHPVNALLIFWLAWLLARRATDLARGERRHVAAPTD